MKKHIKKFEGFKNKSVEKVNELVTQKDDTYDVTVSVEVPAKLLSAYSKKVEQNTNKNPLKMMGEPMLAEKLVLWVIKEGLDAEKIPATAIVGGAQGQAQPQAQPQAQSQDQVEVSASPSNTGEGQGTYEPVAAQVQDEDLPI